VSDRKLTDIVIHDRALNALGLETAIVMLEVARDLRSGAIEAENYDQNRFGRDERIYTDEGMKDCNTPCCIWGHVCHRMGIYSWSDRATSAENMTDKDRALGWLFASVEDATPKRAAQAIENYVISGMDHPWYGTKHIK